MKGKIIGILLTVALIITCLVWLVACGSDDKTETPPPVNTGCQHTYGTGVITQAPTEYEAGKIEYTCTKCQHVQVDSIASLPHDHAFDMENWSTDATYHWHKATCLHEDLASDKEKHQFGNDETCDVCGYQVERLEYAMVNGTWTVTGIGTFKGESVEIPSTYKNIPITAIGDGAFKDFKTITSVVVGNNVKTIGNSAFEGCEYITSVSGMNSVTSIGNRAFGVCRFLNVFKMGEKVTSIGEFAFVNCKNLIAITLPEKLTSMGRACFQGCSNLVSIKIPASLNSVVEYAFEGCTGLKSIEISKGITEIESYAFNGCTGLAKLTIPASVTKIAYRAFNGCAGLADVSFENKTGWGDTAGTVFAEDFNDTALVARMLSTTYCGNTWVRTEK